MVVETGVWFDSFLGGEFGGGVRRASRWILFFLSFQLFIVATVAAAFFFFFSYDFYFSGIWGSYLRVSVSRSLQVFYLIFFPWWCVCSTRLRDPLWNSQCLYLDKNVLIDFLFCLFFPRMTWLKFEENIYVGVVFPFFCF